MEPVLVSSSGATNKGRIAAEYLSAEGFQHETQHSKTAPMHPPKAAERISVWIN